LPFRPANPIVNLTCKCQILKIRALSAAKPLIGF
jgi:hypothetical protein